MLGCSRLVQLPNGLNLHHANNLRYFNSINQFTTDLTSSPQNEPQLLLVTQILCAHLPYGSNITTGTEVKH
jgi:hypothetical protein